MQELDGIYVNLILFEKSKSRRRASTALTTLINLTYYYADKVNGTFDNVKLTYDGFLLFSYVRIPILQTSAHLKTLNIL